MACKHSLCRRRAQPHGAQRGHSADKAICQHRHTGQCTAQKHTAQARDIKAAKLCKNIQCVFRVRLIAKDAAADGIHLAGKPFVREARTAPGHKLHGLAQQHCRHRAGGGGIANAHFTGGDEPVAILCQFPGKGNALPNGLHRLSPAHGRALGKIRRACGNAAAAHAGHRFACHAHIHGQNIAVGRAGHLAHTGTPHGKVFGHGTGHFLPGLAHALRHHAVIRAEHHHHPAGKIKLRTAGKGGGILQHGLQPAQPAQRLCKAGPVGVCRRTGGFVGRGDTRQKCIQFRFGHFGHPFVLLYRSAARTKRPGRGVPAQYKCGNPA